MQPPLKNVIEGATPSFVDENRGHTPPMGLLYMQGAIEQSRHESTFLDANLEGWTHEEAAHEALSHNPDLIGIQAMTFTMPDACLLAEKIKKMNSEVKIIIGGAHPTIYPEETAGLPYIDFAFCGEGEVAFPMFLDRFFDEEARLQIPGIAGKDKDGKVHYSPSDGLLKNLDIIPLPARRSSKYKKYSSVLAKRNPITIMMTSRGCPFQCIFCNRMGRKWRSHSAEFVLKEIEDIVKLGIKEIFIHDDTFSLNRERIVKICEGIIEKKLDVTWEARTRVDCVDEELIKLMKKAGCHRLSFGVESGSEKVIESMRKGIKLERVLEVFKWCKKAGILTLADFMLGNKDEQEEDMEKTFAFAAKLNPDYLQYSILSMYPNTPVYAEAMERGMIGDVWREFARNPISGFKTPVWTQYFSEKELIKHCILAYKRFYFRPTFMIRQLGRIRSFESFKKMARSAIGMLKRKA